MTHIPRTVARLGRDARPLQQRRLQVRLARAPEIYVTSNKDQAPSNIVVIEDKSCGV